MADRLGQQLGNYRLIRILGRGGFAEVYLGEHLRLGTYAAVKVLYTRLPNPDDVMSFEKEARTIAHLRHPHIVRVFDYDVDDDTPFLVMDYATGGTLRKRHPRGTILPLPTIISYIKQTAGALQYAHDQHVIHRDIKPENMLVGERDELLLSDFGIAIVAQSSRYESTQNMVGTMAYMAPEQIQGHPRPASDQYSLGIVVYEWLSGDRPFRGSMTEIVAQHLAVPPPSLHKKIPTISSDVEQVVMTALAKDPKQRFLSIQSFVHALEQASQPGQPAPAKAQSELPRTPPPFPIVESPTTQPSPSSKRYRETSPSREIQALSGDHSPTKVKPIVGPTGGKIAITEVKRKKASVWTIGKRQIVVMIISTALLICLGILGGWFVANYASNMGSSYFIIVTVVLFLGLAEASPLFFGAVFGPWVGFFSGGVGSFLGVNFFISVFNINRGYNLSSIFNQFFDGLNYSSLLLFLAFALIGFIAGLATLKTKGRYNSIRTIALAEGLSVAGIVSMLSITELILEHDYYSLFISYLLPSFLYSLPGLILLPILLFIHSKIANRRTHSA